MFNLLNTAGSYNVQGCDVSTDHTSILVKCTFAINSTAQGFVVVQNEQGQYTINKTLLRLDSDEGSVNISGLSAGKYSVRVYDNMDDDQPAYELESQLILNHIGYIIPTTAITTNIPGKLLSNLHACSNL